MSVHDSFFQSKYAVGDAIEVKDVVSGDPTQVPLAGPANRQGRIAADNALGRAVRYRGTQGTAIVGVFDKTAAMTGASEKFLRRNQRPFEKIYIHPAHHAGYYPGAEGMSLKLLFDPTFVPATVLGLRLGRAVLLYEGSALLVVLNALRLLAYQALPAPTMTPSDGRLGVL